MDELKYMVQKAYTDIRLFYASLLVPNSFLLQKIFERGTKRGLNISLRAVLYKEWSKTKSISITQAGSQARHEP